MKKYVVVAYYFLLYASVAFVIFYLASIDYFSLPGINSYLYFGLSVIFLGLGFFAQGVCWWFGLYRAGINVALELAINSVGATIFTKYIPGKLWQLVGRASYIKLKVECDLKKIIAVSVITQFISLAASTVFIFPLVDLVHGGRGIAYKIILTAFSLIVIATVLVFFLRRLRPHYTMLWKLCAGLPLYCAPWLFWGSGFYLLLSSVGVDIGFWNSIAVFSSASVVGILAYVVPGGIGVRESIISFLLTLLGVDSGEAVSCALLARIWFVFGEFLIFCFAWLNSRVYSRRKL